MEYIKLKSELIKYHIIDGHYDPNLYDSKAIIENEIIKNEFLEKQKTNSLNLYFATESINFLFEWQKSIILNNILEYIIKCDSSDKVRKEIEKLRNDLKYPLLLTSIDSVGNAHFFKFFRELEEKVNLVLKLHDDTDGFNLKKNISSWGLYIEKTVNFDKFDPKLNTIYMFVRSNQPSTKYLNVEITQSYVTLDLFESIISTLDSLKEGDTIYLVNKLFTSSGFYSLVNLLANMFRKTVNFKYKYLKYKISSLRQDTQFISFTGKCQKSIEKIKELIDISRKAFDNHQTVVVPSAIRPEIIEDVNERIRIDTLTYNRILNLYGRSSCLEILNLVRINYVSSIVHAEELDLPLTVWAKNPNKYFFDIIKGLEIMAIDGYKYLLKDIKISEKINVDYEKNIRQLSESVYSYVEISNYEQYKNAELFFNNRYKRLNKLLFEKYNININGKYVSRAWNKMIEILNSTNLLKNYSSVSAFHVCEAPGSFIEAIKWYCQQNNISYSWKAQSLLDSEIKDFYGFIEKTKENWDFGPKNTGDILDPVNFDYYTKTYKNVNLFVSDCGEKWTPDGNSDELTTKQLEYGLSILSKGGSLITKSFVNIGKKFMLLLTECYECFEEVYIYKSYINFWSQEIYICCKNFKGKRSFPSEINEIVLQQFFECCKKVLTFANTYKTFFVYCSFNINILHDNKNIINKIINKLLFKWLDVNIKKLL